MCIYINIWYINLLQKISIPIKKQYRNAEHYSPFYRPFDSQRGVGAATFKTKRELKAKQARPPHSRIMWSRFIARFHVAITAMLVATRLKFEAITKLVVAYGRDFAWRNRTIYTFTNDMHKIIQFVEDNI